MMSFSKVLNNPQDSLKIVHVTGTNGKGSVVQYLKDMFMIHGLKVGTFTSPYIEKFNERIQINGVFISDEDVLKYANQIIHKYDEFYALTKTYPSFFEFLTLMAFLYFKECHVDVAIIEVGIGGLLDSTNILHPITSVITNVSYDHMNILGNTLDEILIQKLGIVKENVPAVIGLKNKHLIKIAEKYCEEKHSLIILPLIKAFEIKKCDELGSQVFLEGFGEYNISMLGYHQIENSIVSIFAFLTSYQVLTHKMPQINLMKKALEKTFWLGRLEVIKKKPLTIIDGGHNIDGIMRVCDFIKTLNFKTKRCIFAVSANKEKEKMLDYLRDYFDEIIITEFTYHRHSEAQELFGKFNFNHKRLIINPINAINYVDENPMDLNLYIGSLYFVSEIRPILLN